MTQEHGKQTLQMLSFFEYGHLPVFLQDISKPFKRTAWGLADVLPDSAELSAALRKLLEAKDCAVRAMLVFDRDQEDE